ncbi:hypothetical protein OS493_026920, partial [Desmophyllum pertusum]
MSMLQLVTVTWVLFTRLSATFEQAKEYHHRALKIRLKELGPEHVNVPTDHVNMGTVQYDLVERQQFTESNNPSPPIGPRHYVRVKREGSRSR